MASTDEVDDTRLPRRVSRSGTRPRKSGPEADTLPGEDQEDIDTVNRLLGFLRTNDDP
jgi:hypothetical protein